MLGFNRVILIGNLGRDPELRTTPSGTQVTNFSLATTEKRKGEKVTTWHRIVAFSKTAEICAQYLRKGSPAQIEGKIQNRSYEKDGQEVKVSEIIANGVLLLGSPPESRPQAQGSQQGGYQAPAQGNYQGQPQQPAQQAPQPQQGGHQDNSGTRYSDQEDFGPDPW